MSPKVMLMRVLRQQTCHGMSLLRCVHCLSEQHCGMSLQLYGFSLRPIQSDVVSIPSLILTYYIFYDFIQIFTPSRSRYTLIAQKVAVSDISC